VKGFTMIELMVTIGIAGVLMAFAVPSMKNMITGRAVQSQSASLVASLKFARTEAMKRSAPVAVCRTTPAAPQTCATASGAWQSWMVFADRANNGTFESANDLALRVENSATTNVVYPSDATTVVTFQANGLATTGAKTWQFDPTVASTSSSFKRYQRKVCLNAQGRVSNVDGNTACST
jgi:type IV fimbrial biogenesis protein FimT